MTLQLHFPPDYVLDRMEMYEVKAVMDYQYLAHKDSWEQSRLVGYIMAQCNSTKKLSQNDIVKFYWEKEGDDAPTTEFSNADKQRLLKKAEKYKQLIKN